MPKKAKTSSYNGQRVTARGKRFLESRAPKIHEDVKRVVLLRGSRTSEKSSLALKAIGYLKRPDAQSLSRRRDVHPFEDASSLERLAQRYDAALFGVALHSKKRPDNLVLGRLFDGVLLDMFEFGVVRTPDKGVSKMLGSKPSLVFVGEWDDERGRRLKNFFADFARGQDVDKVNLAGLEHVLVFTLIDDTVSIVPNRLRLTKSSTSVPSVRLETVGEPLVLQLRRDHAPTLDVWKTALKQPKELKPKKRKNISTTSLGDTIGKIHLAKQDIDALQVRKVKALKKSPKDDAPSS